MAHALRRPFAIPLLLGLAMLGPPGSRADVADTGTMELSITPDSPGFATIDAFITFAPGGRPALGRAIDLASLGETTFFGDAVLDPSQTDGAFEAEGEDEEFEFVFTLTGGVRCEAAQCAGGRGTFAARVFIEEDPMNELPDGLFTLDGSALLDAEGIGIGGTVAVNAFPFVNVAPGANVEVASGEETFFDPVTGTERGFAARATFATVDLPGGIGFAALSTIPGELPAGVALDPALSIFVDVVSEAVTSGTATLCLGYDDADANDVVDGTTVPVAALRLLHSPGAGLPFADITGTAAAGFVCGAATAPGPIVLGVAGAVAPTTTLPPSGTTTTTLPPSATTTTTVAPSSTTTTTTAGPSTTTTTLTPTPTTTSTTQIGGLPSTTSTTVLGASTTSTTCSTTTTTLGPGPTTTSTALGAPSTTTSIVAPLGTTSSTVALLPATTTTTLPRCAGALECLDLAITGPLCPGETLNKKVSTLVLKRLTKAQVQLLRARDLPAGRKATRLRSKAARHLEKLAGKADRFATRRKNAVSAACRDSIRAAVDRVAQELTASRI